MAGLYPDVPGPRFEYDRDGSIVTWDHVNTASTATMQALNNETAKGLVGAVNAQIFIGIAWPEVRSVVGLYTVNQYGLNEPGDNFDVRMSTNTTNGDDGTWTHLLDLFMHINPANVATDCRTDITPVTGATAIRGLQFWPYNYRGGTNTGVIHIYGQTPLTENPDRLVLCDASGAVSTDGAYLDFAEAPRSTTATKTFRVGNNSSTLTANSIAMSFETLYDASPTLAGQFQYSFTGGSTWVTTGNIGSLGPGAVSSVIQIRRNTAAGAAGGPWQSRVVAVPASMT